MAKGNRLEPHFAGQVKAVEEMKKVKVNIKTGHHTYQAVTSGKL